MSLTTEHPLQRVVREAGEKLLAFRVTRLPALTEPSDFGDLACDLRDIAAIFDTVIEEFGEATELHSAHRVDLPIFKKVVSDAIDGNALWEIERQAELLEEDNAEYGGIHDGARYERA